MQAPHADEQPLPFVAPCRTLAARDPLRWLRLGWRDLTLAPIQSLTYGAGISLLSALVLGIAIRFGTGWTVLVLLSAFVFVAPVLVIGLYTISNALEKGERPALSECVAATRRNLGDTLIYSLVLMVICLLWIRAGSAVEIFFPEDPDASRLMIATFLAIGTVVGSLFALVAFSASAFSLPMLADRRVDAVTAVVTSINAVLRNRLAMLVWVILILASIVVGLLLAVAGLAVAMPVIGHATWHAYRETIDASAWPART